LKLIFFAIKTQLDFLRNMSVGATTKFLTKGMLENLKINLPPLPIQQKIAKILSDYDDLIENNLKRIKLLEDSGRLTYEEWFLRCRIDGKKLDINPSTDLPFGWEKKSFTECDAFKQDKRKTKEFEGEKKYYATADITGTTIASDGETINWDNKPSRAQIKPNNNTVWFARMSNTYKVLCFNNKNISLQDNSVISSGFAGFKARNDLCLPFLYFTINSKFFHELKDLYATGATQVSLNNDSMSFIKIIEPSADLVEEFGNRTLLLIEEISVLRSKNQLLKEAQDILLPRLMTGMIDTDDMDIAV
jgi:type I restriction enzyme, S subunit